MEGAGHDEGHLHVEGRVVPLVVGVALPVEAAVLGAGETLLGPLWVVREDAHVAPLQRGARTQLKDPSWEGRGGYTHWRGLQEHMKLTTRRKKSHVQLLMQEHKRHNSTSK